MTLRPLGGRLAAPAGWTDAPGAAGSGPWPDRPASSAVLARVAERSPFLRGLMLASADRLAAVLAAAPERTVAEAVGKVGRLGAAAPAEVGSLLRAARAEVALTVALADIGGVWTLEEVTEALTAFADAALRAGLAALLRDAHRQGALVLPDPERPEEGCGLAVLALGKLGGRELNYSSDIDVVAFFDPDAAAVPAGRSAAPVYVRLVQALARLLADRTAEGIVQRVDLRLRPDPGSTAVAMSVAAALRYYESRGQNWERAALIKARPVAGDLRVGRELLAELAPFVWRRYFDYAAIADIHAMKRQIHVARGHAALAVAGHDVKLGRGGIREIEFFVQTQQLVFGGRRPHLRGARTLEMLAALGRDGWVEPQAVAALTAAYRFLRTVEHRLQMVDDRQTHRLPADPAALDGFARFAGFPGRDAFAAAFLAHAGAVERYYARLFEREPSLTAALGSLVFTGVEDDPATLDTLGRMGFRAPAAVAETVRGWHFGRRPAVRTPRAREVLTALVPALLAALARAGDPDAALATVDAMFGRMPAAVELLSLLAATPALLDLFADILGVAPPLAVAVAARPHLLDLAIDPAGLAAPDHAAALPARVRAALLADLPHEDFLDRARDVAAEERFAIGVRLLSGAATPGETGRAHAALAEAVVAATLAQVRAAFAQAHGVPPGAGCAVVALGRLGSRDMTATSDLDLMLVYEPGDGRDSDGPRPLDAPRYFARLTQRLVAALTVATRRGPLYAVDMRLRPSGRQGPLATALASFRRYHAAEAATWEHMALTRARVVAGDAPVVARVTDAIAEVLRLPRDPAAVLRDAAAMRALVAREKPPRGPWDLKRVPGGLTAIEFLAQALTLGHAAADPALVDPSVGAVLERLGRGGWLPAEEAAELGETYRLLTGLHHLLRLACPGDPDPDRAGDGLRRRLAAIADVPDFAAAGAQVSEATGRAAGIVARQLGCD